MTRHLAAPIGAEQQVTASDLVRHFGVWQDRAARAPVYILHRGRPRLVLTSLDVMDALCAPHTPTPATGATALAALLEATSDIVIIVDRNRVVSAASHGARARFGEATRTGAPIADFASVGAELFADSIARVTDSGIAETAEIAPARFPSRRLQCAIEPFPEGCLVRVRDLTATDEARSARAGHHAAVAAAESAGAIVARIGPRGHVEGVAPALARLTGVAADALATARFSALVEVADRVAIGEAIEQTFAGAASVRVDARLIVRGAAAILVSVGLAPVTEAGRIVALIAAIVPRASAA